MATTFHALAHLAQCIAARPKRLEKAALVAEFCAPLSDSDLMWATRFLSGRVFAGWDKRTLNLGTATLVQALAETCNQTATKLKVELVARGDLGLVAEAFWPPNAVASQQAEPHLTLDQLAQRLEMLAERRGATAKRQALAELWQNISPLEANYLVKLLQGELRCGLKEGALEDALGRMVGCSITEVQRANMLLGDIGETALCCRKGTLADAKMRLFHPLKCMLASAGSDAATIAAQMSQGFVAEDKYDGIRAQAHIGPADEAANTARGQSLNGVHVAIFSRTQEDLTQAFPDLLEPLAGLCSKTAYSALVLDAEIIAVDGEQSLPFARLQTRLGRKAPDLALQAAVPVCFVAFDLLFVHKTVLFEQPLATRRKQLESIQFGRGIRLAPQLLLEDAAGLHAAFDAARERSNEGLVVKDPNSKYSPGRRGQQWIKLKRPLANLDVVVTAAEVGHGRRHKWLSDYTFAVRTSAQDATLLNIGKAYSGLTDVEIQRLTLWFRAHSLASFAHGKVMQVQPQIVLEVTFDKVQASSRHKSGYALRFPRIVRLRPDKPADEINTLADVAALCEQSASIVAKK